MRCPVSTRTRCQAPMRCKVAIDRRHRRSDPNDQLLSAFSAHRLLIRSHLLIWMMLVRKCENWYQHTPVFRIIKEFRPIFAPQFHAASEAVGPVVPMGNAVVVFEEQR